MKLKTYRISYKNGNVRNLKAYSMEIVGDKIYECSKALVGDQGVPHVWSAENVLSIEELDE